MAIGIGTIVLPAGALAIPNSIGPIQGYVVSGAGPFVIRWANSTIEAAAVAASLDAVTLDPTVAATLVGRQVKVNSPTGQTNYGRCICMDVYQRNPAGAGVAVTYALLVNIATLYAFEALASDCEAVT